MSRHGYIDECDMDGSQQIRWRGAVTSALRGKRGQAFLREMREALDALPEKKLIERDLVTPEGQVCAMGAVCEARGLDVSDVDPEDYEDVAATLGISEAMAREIAYENDEHYWPEDSDMRRWDWMSRWVDRHLRTDEGGEADEHEPEHAHP